MTQKLTRKEYCEQIRRLLSGHSNWDVVLGLLDATSSALADCEPSDLRDGIANLLMQMEDVIEDRPV